MDVLFFAYANHQHRPLESLQGEDNQTYQALSPRQQQRHYLIHRDSFAQLNNVGRDISLYRQNLVLFHYSGHAGQDALELDGGEARALGIAQLLGKCPRLRVVVLNGCSTKGQVELLLDAGVPAVVATSAPVEDEKAKHFAIRLYQSLTNGETLGDAFDLAVGQVLGQDDTIAVHRGAGRVAAEPPDDLPLWGFYGQPEVRGWKLPADPAGYELQSFTPNALLLDRLTAALADDSEEIRRLYQMEETGLEVSILDKREAILKTLPHPISEHVRKLLVPGAEAGQFYDQLSPARLQQLATVYEALTELLLFILLAQLWDALNERENFQIEDETRAEIRRWLSRPAAEGRTYDVLPLIRAIRQAFDANGVDYFVPELSKLSDGLRAGGDFARGCDFMQSLRVRLARQLPNETEAAYLCVLAEEQLAAVLCEIGFIARYTFASVKGIDVVKYRHIDSAQFRHRIVRLVQRFVGLAEEPVYHTDYMDTTSVLLLRSGEGSPEFLNLTPFILDENAFDEKASIAKLQFFERYAAEQDAYVYRHVYKPLDLPLVIRDQKHFKIVRAQFDAFAQLIFQQKMRQAV